MAKTKSRTVRIGLETYTQIMKMCNASDISVKKFFDKIVPELYDVFNNFVKVGGFFVQSYPHEGKAVLYVGGKNASDLIVSGSFEVGNEISGEQGDKMAIAKAEKQLSAKFEKELKKID